MILVTNNKKASFDYFIEGKIEAGIVLAGSEVKSARSGGVSLVDSFVKIDGGEVWLKNAYIKPYEKSSAFTPDSKRNRKLLLSKKEIAKLKKESEVDGKTIIPLKVYINDAGLVKIEIGIAKGKKLYDKRQALKEKSMQKDIEKVRKNFSCI